MADGKWQMAKAGGLWDHAGVRWRKVIVWAVAAIVVVVVGWAVFREREPRYNGKTLSEWMVLRQKDFIRETPALGTSPALEALRAIGTNGVPYLLEWLQYDEPASLRTLCNWVLRLPSQRVGNAATGLLLRRSERAVMSTVSFRDLGPGATNAIPELSRIMGDAKAKKASDRAVSALMSLGPVALPALRGALSNPTNHQREWIARQIGEIQGLGTNGHAAVPVLLDCVRDSDSGLKQAAIRTLGRLGLDPDAVVPVLAAQLADTNWYTRRVSALALGDFGRNGASAVPVLLNALDDPDAFARDEAEEALKRIAPEALEEDKKTKTHKPPTIFHPID